MNIYPNAPFDPELERLREECARILIEEEKERHRKFIEEHMRKKICPLPFIPSPPPMIFPPGFMRLPWSRKIEVKDILDQIK